jgi:Monodechloroaminopyrrolnitrin synthase PrnB
MSTADVRRFDEWIRGPFRDLNTELEERYVARPCATNRDVGQAQKLALCQEGQQRIAPLSAWTSEGDDRDGHYDLLGNLGFYMAACARHEIDEAIAGPAARNQEATALALAIGARLGVAPRLLSSHLMTHNAARDGRYKTFTRLRDEVVFLDVNTTSVLAYERAARAVLGALPLGVSHPVAAALLAAARHALHEVITTNRRLLEELDDERFFHNVRAYYKPHRVGSAVYRGPNAGDFAAISVLDLMLGLCRPSDPSYSQLLLEKMPYLAPEDQSLLRRCLGGRSLMDEFLGETVAHAGEPWFKRHLALFLDVCTLHGQATSEHHDKLVAKFIREPTARMPLEARRDNLTASGPPLPVVLAALEKLRDRRCARLSDGVSTRYHDIQRLTALL